MSLREDFEKIHRKMERIEDESFALELLGDFKQQNKRLFVIILVVLIMWFASIGIFVHYINTVGYEIITESADTGEGGNACVGDSCNNGVINGKSN